MRARTVFLMAIFTAVCSAGCRSKSTLPWRLMELGTDPIVSAWNRGEAVAVFTEGHLWPGFIFPNDSSPQGRIMRRDALTMPAIMCGDKMRIDPHDFPLGWVEQFGWETDSLTVQWQCLDRTGLAALGAEIVRNSPQPEAEEVRWLDALMELDPPRYTEPSRPFLLDEKVRLAITCQRPNGAVLGDTVRLDFRFGESGQVVDAIVPGLQRAGPGAHWTVWSASSQAFGSHGQPELNLLAHTPLQFSVYVE